MIWEFVIFLVQLIFTCWLLCFLIIDVVMISFIIRMISELRPSKFETHFSFYSNKEVKDMVTSNVVIVLILHISMVLIYKYLMKDWIWTTTA